MTGTDEAQASLTAMAEARGRLAIAAKSPLWRHLLFAGVMGAFVAIYALPRSYQGAMVAMLLCSTSVLVWQDRQRTGLFINGFRRGRTGWIAFGLVAAVLLAFGAAAVARYVYGVAWAPLAIGAAVFVLSFGASLKWEQVYFAEIGAQGAADEGR